MATWTPDPTFYPSPRLAARAPAEKLAYVASFDPQRRRPDALAVVDVDPGSSSYAQIVGKTELAPDDELHHFGWNACSSCLCPNAPHAHVERRYLIVPGLRSSRMHILDTKPSPRQPQIVRTIEAAEIAERAGYSRPHTVHCGPDGIYVSALGNAEGKGPGGVFLIDHESFQVLGRWEVERGPQQFAYDFWWHLGYDTMVTSEWGTPDMFEDGLVPEKILGAQYGRRLHFWDLHKRKHVQAIDFGDKYQLVFELRPAHDPTKAYGFVNCVLSLEDLSSSIWTWYRDGDKWAVKKVITIPAERDRRLRPTTSAATVRRRPAARERHRPLGGPSLAVRLLLGNRRTQAVRRQRPAQPEGDGLGAFGRHRRPHAAPRRSRAAPRRRAPDGGGEPGRPARLHHELALFHLGRRLLPGRRGRLGRPDRCGHRDRRHD